MIKRIIVAFITGLAMLVPIMAISSTAEAAGCTYKSKYTEAYIHSMDADGGNAGLYAFRATMWYSSCTTHAYFHKYTMQISEMSGVCGETRSWKVNPNVIGTYNPGEQQRYCQNDDPVDVMTWDPASIKIPYYAPDNEKCLGAIVTLDNPYNPDLQYSYPSLCVTFAQ